MKPLALEIDDMRDGYRAVLAEVLLHGQEVSPRGLDTVEVRGATIVLTNPYDALPVGVGRGVNPGLAAAEALDLIGEWSNPALLSRIIPHVAQYAEPDGTFYGAYGTRSNGQMTHVQNELRRDPSSRRAYVAYWSPTLDRVTSKKNYPCMTSMQFMVRGGLLEAFTYMRANDTWNGLAMDVYVATQLQITLANTLGLRAGAYTHHASSLHLYAEHLDRAYALVKDLGVEPSAPACPAEGVGAEGMSWWVARQRARAITRGGTVNGDTWPLTDSERWYQAKIGKYLAS